MGTAYQFAKYDPYCVLSCAAEGDDRWGIYQLQDSTCGAEAGKGPFFAWWDWQALGANLGSKVWSTSLPRVIEVSFVGWNFSFLLIWWIVIDDYYRDVYIPACLCVYCIWFQTWLCCYRYLFDARKLEASELLTISKSEVSEWFSRFLDSSSAVRQKLSIHIWGCNAQAERNNRKDSESTEDGDVTVINDLQAFKHGKELFPVLIWMMFRMYSEHSYSCWFLQQLLFLVGWVSHWILSGCSTNIPLKWFIIHICKLSVLQLVVMAYLRH